jgi:hypothetical protein
VHHGLRRVEQPVIGVRAFDPHAGLVAGDDLSLAQGRDGRVATRTEAALRAAEQVHQPALAEREAEQVGERRLQPLIRERLKGLQVRRHRMQPWAEGRAARCRGRWRDHARPAGRTTNGNAPMLRHMRRHRGQLDPLRDADDLSAQVPRQDAAAARARLRTMLDDRIGIVAQHPAVTLVTRFGTAWLGLRALLLAIRGRWFGRGA